MKVPSQAKGVGTFSFEDGFEARIQSTGSLPVPACILHWGALDGASYYL
jgi:hypothetical protein